MTAIGVDFGTSNSVVSAWTPGGIDVLSMDQPLGEWHALDLDRVMPSVFGVDGGGRATFGWAAKRSERVRIEAVKRLFATQDDIVEADGQIYIVDEIVTMLFAEMRARAERQGIDIERAVVTIPANSRGAARARTRQCAAMAGIRVLTLVNEPMAAAMAHCARRPGDQRLLVFDWGGGTLDVTFLSSAGGYFIEEASMGLPLRGGIDFDAALGRLLAPLAEREGWTPEQRRRFDLDVELAKIRLSSVDSVAVQLPGGRVATVARVDFEAATRHLVEDARAPLARCLDDVGIGAQVIDAVVMVGGTSKIPAVRRFVADLLGREPGGAVDPMTAVSEGAAVSAAILEGRLPDSRFFVCSEHALGVEATTRLRGDDAVFSPIIPRNHILPAEGREVYQPVHAEQSVVRLRLLEGDPDKPVEHPDNVVLKTWNLTLPHRPGATPEQRACEVTFRYDAESLLHVTVVEVATGAVLHDEPVSYGGAPDDIEQLRIALRARRAVETRDVEPAAPAAAAGDAGARKLLRLAGRAVAGMEELGEAGEADTIRASAEALRTAVPGDVAERKAALRALLRPWVVLDDEGALTDDGGQVPGAAPPSVGPPARRDGDDATGGGNGAGDGSAGPP